MRNICRQQLEKVPPTEYYQGIATVHSTTSTKCGLGLMSYLGIDVLSLGPPHVLVGSYHTYFGMVKNYDTINRYPHPHEHPYRRYKGAI